jgi:outer membrane protein insertion porin family
MNKRTVMARRWILCVAATGFAAAAWAVPIRDIRVAPMGAVPVSAEQVLAQVSARVGQELDRAALSEDIRALQRSGAYSYAEARLEPAADGGTILWFRVEGRPKIRSLTITGADYLGNKKVRTLMEIGSGDRADNSLLGQKAQKVRDNYRKEFFPETKVAWTFKPVVDNPEFTDVDIQVAEGRRAVVRRILFKGNRHVPRRELLKVMSQKQSSWLSMFNNAGIYEPGSLLADRESIRKVFMDKGYLGATIDEPTFTYVGRKKIDIAFAVAEGPVYTLADWRIGGLTLFPSNEVARGVMAAPGKLAALDAIQRGAQNIRDFYGARGYIKTEVDPRIRLDTNAASASVSYQVKEGTLAYIQNVEIRGNSQTKDKVIRREINVMPGDIYNEVKVRSSENRVRNLNYFSFVSTYPESTAVSNRYNLIFDVEEQRTGQFMIGAGLSSVDNLVGFVELTQGNFDLFGWPHFSGGGQKLKLRAQVGSKRTDLEMSLIEPWFLNRRLSLGLDLFRHENSYDSDEYDQVNTGGSLTLGKPLFTFNRINWIYGLENIDISNISSNASPLILAEEGGRLKSSGTVEFIRDTRNSTFVATRGFRGSASATLAGGPFGGETDTYQFQLRASQFVPLWFDHVLNLRGWTSMINEYGDSDRVPIFDRLFAGGPRTVRAFRYRKVGPKDEDDEPIGGRSAATASAEYTLPIVEKVRLAAFYDVGVVWQDLFDKDLEHPAVGDGVVCDGYGIGVRFDFPMFPIQLDYAWPLNTDEVTGDGGRFSFFIGYTY